ncbi:MAG: hypothetical protein R3F56_04115 [Planctomycetota bacterium]
MSTTGAIAARDSMPGPQRIGEGEDDEGAEYPIEAARSRWRRMADENDQIPPGALTRALSQRAALMALDGTGGVDPGSWEWKGPENVGGRVRAIWIHPSGEVMLAGSSSGGLWRSTDLGSTWQAVDDWLPSLSISCLVSHPSFPSGRLYAGTGEYFPGSYLFAGAGIYVSTDSGMTWRQMPSTTGYEFRIVTELAINPGNQDKLLAATSSGLFYTDDAGGRWMPTTSSFAAHDVKFHKRDGSKAVASGYSSASGRAQVLYSPDGGVTWMESAGLPTTFGRCELAFATDVPDRVLAAVAIADDDGALYRSEDAGRTFVLASRFNLFYAAGGFDNSIWVDPQDSRNVLVGGVDVFRSLDTGATWSSIPRGHQDIHTIVEDPRFNGVTNKVVYVGCDGGVFRYDDVRAASPTVVARHQGLGITQFYGGAVTAAGLPLGGSQDNGTHIAPNSLSKQWREIEVHDGIHCAADPVDPLWVYGTTQKGGVFRCRDGGFVRERIEPTGGAGVPPFITPILLDPNDSKRLYLGLNELMVTDNVKAPGTVTWRPVTTFGDTEGVQQFAVAIGDSDRVWAVHDWQELWFTANGTSSSPSWVQLTPPPGNAGITCLAVDPRDPSRVFVGLSGFVPTRLWNSTGSGTWRNASGLGAASLPAIPIYAIALHPRNAGWIYVGTEIGLYVSTDDGRTWSTSNEGPANVAIDHLVFHGDDLWAFTHGRGAFRAHASTASDGWAAMTRASVDTFEVEGNGNSLQPTVTEDGRHVAFTSLATNLVAGDTNGFADVFVRDTRAGTTTLVSARPGNSQAEPNGSSFDPSIAHGGRFVAFASNASNLVSFDTNGKADVFVRDLQGQVTQRVSLGSTGVQANEDCRSPSITADGRYVVFTTAANNMGAPDTNGMNDVFLRDTARQTTVRVSTSRTSAAANGASSNTFRSVSADGNLVVFESNAPDLVANDTNNVSDVFVRDVAAGTTVRVSVDSNGNQANSGSSYGTISGDGRFVTFQSAASNLVQGDLNAVSDVFVHDLQTGQTSLVSVGASGAHGNATSSFGVISPDGRYVSFLSDSTNLVANDTNGVADVFLRDLQGRTLRVSEDASGRDADAASFLSDVAGSGSTIAFQSTASNLVRGDFNGREDIFVARPGWRIQRLPNGSGLEGNTWTEDLVTRPTGRLQEFYREPVGLEMVSRMSFRPDGGRNLAFATARNLDLEVRMGACDIDVLTTTFDQNYIAPPSVVLNRQTLRFPDLTAQGQQPTAFEISVPLDFPYVPSTAHGLCWEMLVYGSDGQGAYPIDAHGALRTEFSTSVARGRGCQTANGLFHHSVIYSSSGQTSNLNVTGLSGPAQAPLFLALGGSDPNVQLPGFCASLRSSADIILSVGQTGSTGSAERDIPLPPWNPGLLGANLYTQMLGIQNGPALVLSDGLQVTFPLSAPGPVALSLFAPEANRTQGTLLGYGIVVALNE